MYFYRNTIFTFELILIVKFILKINMFLFNLSKFSKKILKKVSKKIIFFKIKFFNRFSSKVNFFYYFLRKNKLFIKNKYPRNRQWSKNIIYFGIWLNILIIFLAFLYCYHFLFNLDYFWWVIFINYLVFCIKLYVRVY